MWRWPDYKEAVAWLRAYAQGPTGFYLWGSIYPQRAIWDGSAWRWLKDSEQKAVASPPSAPPISGEPDLEYQSRLDAERCTLQFRQAISPTCPVHSHEDLPLFGGDRQEPLL